MLMSPYFDQSLLSDSAENELGLKWTVLIVDESETGRFRTRVEVFSANGDGYGSEQTVSGQNSPNQWKCKNGRSKSVNVNGRKVDFNNITKSYMAVHF